MFSGPPWSESFAGGFNFSYQLKLKVGIAFAYRLIEALFVSLIVRCQSLPHERSECCGYGDVLDILVQKRKDKQAATRFFKQLMKGQGCSAREIVTDKLPSCGAARKAIMPTSMHRHDRYANNRAEVSHQQTRAQERQMRRFKSPGQAPLFLAVHSQVHNLFCVGRHLLRAANYRLLRNRSFEMWQQVTCAC
jgi:putative transposase